MARCGDVMTREPACCEPADSIARIAQLMKSEDVGAVPVVELKTTGKLVGIVTDRDIVVKIVADGKTVEKSTARDAMTNNPVTCREDDDVSQAVARMAERKVRRIPIVDANGALKGIIAQADIATRVHRDTTTGELVEAISEPGTVRK
jgi:CBS domain-containing protein